MSSGRFLKGYLLVEMLAVITLVAMVFVAVMPGLIPKADAIGREELIDRLRSFDEHARIASIREGPLLLRSDPETGSLILQKADSEATVRQLRLDNADVVLLSAETGRPVRGLAIDRLGRGDAYSVFVDPADGKPLRIGFGRHGLATSEGDR